MMKVHQCGGGETLALYQKLIKRSDSVLEGQKEILSSFEPRDILLRSNLYLKKYYHHILVYILYALSWAIVATRLTITRNVGGCLEFYFLCQWLR